MVFRRRDIALWIVSGLSVLASGLNPNGFGHHVLIEVDGSHLPRRHWSRLWSTGYQIPAMMEQRPSELVGWLQRKRRDYRKSLAA